MIVKWRPIKVVTYLMRLTSDDSRHYKTTTDGQRQSSRKISSAMDWFCKQHIETTETQTLEL